MHDERGARTRCPAPVGAMSEACQKTSGHMYGHGSSSGAHTFGLEFHVSNQTIAPAMHHAEIR